MTYKKYSIRSPIESYDVVIEEDKYGDWVHVDDLQEHYIDKAKVKEAIGDIVFKTSGCIGLDINNIIMDERRRILSKLGLK